LDGYSQCMADMQGSSNVWGRHWNHKSALFFGCAILRGLRLEEALGLPPVVPSRFDRNWIVPTCHGLRHVCGALFRRKNEGEEIAPFFSPLGVVFTNAGSCSFFSFSAFAFFSPAGVLAACLTCLAANLASFSSLLASFFAGIDSRSEMLSQ
jgi:hypothetical protein